MRPIGDWSMSMTLSRCSRPSIASCGAGRLARAVEPLGHRLVERLDDQRRLAAAGDAGDAGEGAERDVDGDVLEVVGARALDAQPLAGAGAARFGHRDLLVAGQVLRGQAGRVAHHLVGRAGGDHLAAMDAGARPHVDQVVGGADRLLVVLDDDHGVAEVAQPLQRLQQARVVALVQADRRLVEHVEHAGQAGADLRGEPDALALAARQRARVARQRQVFEPDIDQEAEPLVDLLQDARGDLAVLLAQRLVQRREPRRRLAIDISVTSLMCRPLILTASASGFRRWPLQTSHGFATGSARAPRAPRRCRSRASAARGSGSRPRTACSSRSCAGRPNSSS